MRSRSKVALAAVGLAVIATAGFGAGHAQASRRVPEPAAAVERAAPPTPRDGSEADLVAPALTAKESAAPAEMASTAAPKTAPVERGSILADTPPEAIPQLLASTFDSEQVDRSWAAPTSLAMREGATQLEVPGVTVRDVSCRSSMCRVDVRLTSDAPPPRSFFDGACLGPDSKWAALHVGCYLGPAAVRADGQRDVVLFAFRDGQLP